MRRRDFLKGLAAVVGCVVVGKAAASVHIDEELTDEQVRRWAEKLKGVKFKEPAYFVRMPLNHEAEFIDLSGPLIYGRTLA
jgi:hypothetical protein